MTSTTQPRPPIFLTGNRTGVLLLHGFSGTIEDFRPLAERLHREGWTVLADWLAGHGTSAEDLASKQNGDWVLSVRKALLTLREQCDKIVIVGNSFGGNLALYASLIGEPIVGVVTICTPTMFRGDLLKRTFLPLLERVRPFRKKRWVTNPAEHAARGSYTHVPLKAFRQVMLFIDRHTKRELEGVNVPLLIFQGTKDSEVNTNSAYTLFEHVATSDKRIVWLKDTDHHVLRSAAAPDVAEQIVEFVHRLTK